MVARPDLHRSALFTVAAAKLTIYSFGIHRFNYGRAILSSREQIQTLTATSGTDQDYTAVTGTQVGTKRAADVSVISDTSAIRLADLMPFISGTLPDISWDEIQFTATSSTSHLYQFFYRTILEFEVTVTNPSGDYNISATDYALYGFEQNDGWLLNEDGTNINLES